VPEGSNFRQFVNDKDTFALASGSGFHNPQASFLFKLFCKHDVLTRKEKSHR